MSGILLEWDKKILLYLNHFSGSWLDPVLGWTTFLGYIAVAAPLVFVLILIFDRGNLWSHFFSFFIPVALIDLGVHLLKFVIARPRPYDALASDIAGGTVILKLIFGPAHSNYSFPSGHAALAFAAALILNYLYKGRLTFLYVLAVLIALSRIYTGVHFPSDILGGTAIGVAGALAAIGILRKQRKEKQS